MSISLSPTQGQARDELRRVLRRGEVALFVAGSGMGKTTVLREVHDALGGRFIAAHDLMTALEGRHPLALEEAFYDLVWRALSEHETVVVDDLHLLASVVCCSHAYPRQGFLGAPLMAFTTHVRATGKRILLGTEPVALPVPWTRERLVQLGDFGVADYEHVCRAYLPPAIADALDYDKIHRFARKLSAAQLRSTCEALSESGAADTERFIDYLRAHHLAANVDLGEVQAVELRDLKGLDDVLEALEANVILPLEHTELAAELALKPKRGVLLAGPPGTGKTTVGRALAHRLKSKFFLIDGTVISGTGGFYARIHEIFEAAKRNAPAIIFIDDSDVLFEGGAEAGFYRYLLTVLDGIESESAARVCLMMTAMNVANLPPALVRSGRIELWLEMRLPDEAARAAILADQCAELPASMGAVDVPRLAAATEGLSGADLRRLVDDGKVLFAYDKARGRPLRPVVEYFLDAVHTVRANKERYAEAEARARAQRPARPSFFEVFEEMASAGGMGMAGLAVPGGGVSGVVHVVGDVEGG